MAKVNPPGAYLTSSYSYESAATNPWEDFNDATSVLTMSTFGSKETVESLVTITSRTESHHASAGINPFYGYPAAYQSKKYDEFESLKHKHASLRENASRDLKSPGTVLPTQRAVPLFDEITTELVGNFKSVLDVERERNAQTRALRLQKQLLIESHKNSQGSYSLSSFDDSASGSTVSAITTAITMTPMTQKDALKKFKSQPRSPLEEKKKPEKKDSPGTAQPKLLVRKKLETLAESSRRKKELTEEDIRDPETIAGMKCKMDIETEESSKAMALRMVEDIRYQYSEANNGVASTTSLNMTYMTSKMMQAKLDEKNLPIKQSPEKLKVMKLMPIV